MIFALALSLTVLTVVLHSLSTYVALANLRRMRSPTMPRTWIRVVAITALLVIFLLIVHLAEAALWAAALYWWEALPDYSTALYYSLTSYSTVGYGDVLLPESARLLGPIESLMGVLMLGWSTAVIVAVVQQIFREMPLLRQSPAANSPTGMAESPMDAPANKLPAPERLRDP